MAGSKYIKLLFLLFILSSNIILSTDYYISSSTGNDTNSGLSESSPWKSIAKVNSMSFLPGDKVLFKKNDKWQERIALQIKNSGTASNRIVYSAFGEGNKPIISAKVQLTGWNLSANWSLTSNQNIWRIYVSSAATVIRRLWLSGTEYPQAEPLNDGSNNGAFDITKLNSTDRWHSYNGYIYVYATTNPASFYTNIEVPALSSGDNACRLIDADYITLENIDFRGGYESIQVEACNNLIIQDCNIGRDARNDGIFVYTSSAGRSDYGIVRRCTVDYYINYAPYWHNNVSFGIHLAGGSSYWKVHDNYVKDFSGSCIRVLGGTAGLLNKESMYNEIFNNDVSTPTLAYGRGLHCSGGTKNDPNARAEYNKFYNNYIHHCNVRIQFTGDNNEFMYNTIAFITDSYNTFPLDHAQNTSGHGIYFLGSEDNSCSGNKVYNNTFYNIERAGLWVGGENNIIVNNLLINCGRKENTYRYGLKYGGSNNIYKNNLFWYSNFDKTDMLVLTNRNAGTLLPDIFGYARTIDGFNKENGQNGNIISGNLQHIGTLNSLVVDPLGEDFSLASNSLAINSGVNETWMQKFDQRGNSIIGSRDVGAIEFTGTQSNQNSAPQIISNPILIASVGINYSYDVNTNGSPVPSFKLLSYPSGMTINSTTGLIQWTPSATGNYNVTVEANNGVSPNATQVFTISVSAASSNSPVINTNPVKSALVGQIYSYDVNASGNPVPTYKLSDSPSNMTINSSTGLIQWTPTSSGSFTVTIEASNGISPVSVQSFVISVSENTAIIPEGAISYWKLDEKSGTAFKDEIGNNDALAISLPVAVTGLVGGAQKFNGSSKLDVPANSSFDFSVKENFSVEFWYNGSGAPSTVKSAVGRYLPNGTRWWVGLNAGDGRARFYIAGGGASASINGAVVTDGKWHHITATRNGSTGVLKLYVDGVYQSSITKIFTVDFVSTTANLNIGWYNFQDAYSLTGNLDEVAIYKAELSPEQIKAHYSNGIQGLSYFNTFPAFYAVVNTKIFLQGPYYNGIMSTILRSSSLPSAQPYNIAPWNYTGSEKVTSFPSDVVDWVLVDLRTSTAISSSVKKRVGLLKKDGSIVDIDGISKLKFEGVASGSYYIVIIHRNHLDVMSSTPVAISSSSSLYDFTSASSKAYGFGSMVNLGDDVFGMISGDGDANGLINVLDYGTVSRYINQTGYLQGDYDLNNIVDAYDFDKSGSGLFQSTKVPQ